MSSRAKSAHPSTLPPSPGGPGASTLKILVSGASGLVGSHACRYLAGAGYSIARLVRRQTTGQDEVNWSPAEGRVDPARLAGHDAVLHLSGENILGRWTVDKKNRIRESRVKTTRVLSEAIAGLEHRPRVLVCASAIGFYGDRGEETVTEDSGAGSGFLADVCREWEQAADAARLAGIRVLHLRLGVVFSAAGGALAQMLTPFRMGVGGVIGSGRQWMSWIGMADLLRVIEFSLADERMRGPVNAVSPNPVRNRELTRTLGALLHRPTIMPVPATMLRLAFGGAAEETLLASTRAIPARLAASGFQFQFPLLQDALRHELPGR